MLSTTLKQLQFALLAGIIFISGCQSNQKQSNPKLDKLKVPEGFVAEHLYSPSANGQGSWVGMTFDDKGRMIVSDQYGALYRLNIPAIGDTSKVKIEQLKIGTEADRNADTTTLKLGMGYAQGLLYAFNSLYVMVNDEGDTAHSRPSGIYRLEDTDKDDQYDRITLLINKM